LLKPEDKEQLTVILTYHVIPGKVMAADVVGMDETKTVNGKMINVEVDGSSVTVNDTTMTAADIAASAVRTCRRQVILPRKGWPKA
jgi:uncharacterized surface protein with fasciclin (FAS1) repeats